MLSSILSFLFPDPAVQAATGGVVAAVMYFTPILWRALVAGWNAVVSSVKSGVAPAAAPTPASAPAPVSTAPLPPRE